MQSSEHALAVLAGRDRPDPGPLTQVLGALLEVASAAGVSVTGVYGNQREHRIDLNLASPTDMYQFQDALKSGHNRVSDCTVGAVRSGWLLIEVAGWDVHAVYLNDPEVARR